MPRVDIRRAQRISVHEVGAAPVKVGRLTDNDLVLRNIHVSRHHCVIERVEGKVRVRDLDSQSGTWLNGDRINKEAFAYAGDRISVGPFDLVLRAAPEDVDFISRNSALDEALKHVTVDDDTGLPVEGPAAMVDDLKKQLEGERKQLEAERKQHRKTASQVEGLLQQVDDLQAQMAASERSGLLHDEPPPPVVDDARIAELEQALADAADRARNAERREIERIASLNAEVESMNQRALEAEDRAGELARDLDSLRRETMPPSAAEQIAEMEGLLGIERRRAQSAERQVSQLAAQLEAALSAAAGADRASELQALLETERQRADDAAARAADLESRFADLQREREELASASERSTDLHAQLEQERQRADEAAARVNEIESSLSTQIEELRRERESGVQNSQERRDDVSNLQDLLREARTAAESASADHRSTLEQLREVESTLAQWRTRSEEAERSLETERAHAADLNRALEEAWHRIDDADQSANVLHGKVEELETTRQQQAERAAEALAAHVAEIERLTNGEAILNRELELAQSQRQSMESSVEPMRERLQTAEDALHHALARASELEQSSTVLQDRLAAAEREARERAEQAAAELAAREQTLADLQTSEETLKQRLNNLEATKYAASQKAERALGTLNLLQGQIRSLDDAAAKVTDLQSRLARIEEAWVTADESLEGVDENDDSQVAAAVEQRQRIVAELDALNKARDAAVASLRESAMRLRSISDRQTPTVVALPSPPKQAPEKAAAAAGGGGKKWWKLKK